MGCWQRLTKKVGNNQSLKTGKAFPQMRPQTRKSGQAAAAVVVLCMALLFATDAMAQQATAKIVGAVTDPQGAVVPGVKVTVTNRATNVSVEATSDKSGYYQVLNLPIGTYRITAHRQGFRAMEMLTAPLEINQSFRADLKLEVGTANEQVLVESQASTVETVNPTLGESVTSRPIVNMPLNGRNVLSLALLQPGVTEDNPDDTSSTQGFNIGGGRTDSVTYLLDGGVNNDLLNNGVVMNPNPDAVAEFRILTSNYTAEYGRNGAGIISVVTKSGTNDFHGSAFEFVRNTDFDANEYFNKDPLVNAVPLPRNNLKRNQYGGTFGGPIVKNRLFFFAAYQGQRQIETDVLQAQQTFTTAEIGGNFSQAIAFGTQPYSAPGVPDGPVCAAAAGCIDPNVVAFLQANPYFQPNAALASQAIINPGSFDPGAIAYIAATLPNGQPQIPSNAAGLISPNGGSTDNINELTTKIDFNITSKDRLTVGVSGNRGDLVSPFGGPGGSFSADSAPGFPSGTKTNNSFLNIAYTRTFSPTMLNELRVTAQRRNYQQSQPATTLSPVAGFGIVSDISTGPPTLTFDNGLTLGQDPYGPTFLIGNTFVYADTFSWVQGHNTWKFGGGFSAYQQNTLYDFFGDSEFGFYGYASGGEGTGNSLADFLVGAPNFVYEGSNAASNIRSKAVYGFGQDEWRVRPNLTLSLGLRYEYSTPKLDTLGRSFAIIPGDQSTRFPYAPQGLVFPGDAGAPRGANFPDKTNFGPRVGFAFSPGSGSKTSLRGGFGVFYDVLKGEDNLQFNGAPPFYAEPSAGYPCLPSALNASCPISGGNPPINAPLGFYSQPWGPGAPNPFPSTFPPNPSTAFNPATGDFLPFGGYESALFFVNPHLHTPYTYQYNLSLQHQLASNLIAEVNYVGSSAKGLTALQDVNPFILSTVNGSNPTRVLNNYINQNPNSAMALYCANQFDTAADCPFTGDEPEFKNITFANFNSLEASLTKQNGDNRIIGNTYFTLAFTYGHSLDNASGFRNRDSQVPAYDANVFYASSDFDVKERITFSGGWDLPFDRAWASGPRRLVKGWSLYPILSWRTGFPLSINSGLSGSNNADPGPSGAGDGYLANANFAPGFSKIAITNPKTNGTYYFNPAAFVSIPDAPGNGYGTTGRDFFRGPGRTNLDLALAKTTAITERVNVEFRVEGFNVLNHTELANPDANIDDSTFGQVTTTTLGTGTNALQTQRILQLAARLTF
jgi:hypothetical protein